LDSTPTSAGNTKRNFQLDSGTNELFFPPQLLQRMRIFRGGMKQDPAMIGGKQVNTSACGTLKHPDDPNHLIALRVANSLLKTEG
jgi:hypothetical protein